MTRVLASSQPNKVQDSWGLEIAGYLYLGGLGAGAFVVAVVLDWLGFGLAPLYGSPFGDWLWDWSKLLVLCPPVIAAAGASLLVLDLGRNWFLFFTAGRNPRTSWMARGFGILLAFILTASLAGAVSMFAPASFAAAPVLWRLMEAIAVVAALGTAVYTGVLLRSMKYIPAWNASLLPLLFLASALSTGSMTVLLGSAIVTSFLGEPALAKGVVRPAETFEPLLILVEGALLALYVRSLLKGKPEAVLSARILLSGAWRYPFWMGVVGCALVLPLLLGLINLAAGSDYLAFAGALGVLLGGFILRLGVLRIGLKERPPLYKLGEWRGQRALGLRV